MHRAVCSSETGIHKVILWRKCSECTLQTRAPLEDVLDFFLGIPEASCCWKENLLFFCLIVLQFLLLTASIVHLWMRHTWQIQLEALDVSTTQHCSGVFVSVQSTHIEMEKRHWLGVCYQVTWPYRGFSPAGSDRQVFLSRALPDWVSRAAA